MKTPFKFCLLPFCLCIATLAGCSAPNTSGDSTTGHAASDSNVQNAIVLLFDLSGSTAAPAIRQRYQSEFDTILNQVGNGTVLMGDRITDNTLATSSFPINVSFPVYSAFTDNPLKHQQTMKKERVAAESQAKTLFASTAKYPHTDLMNAFQLAAKIFNGDKCSGAQNKILVIFSDMVEQSKRYDFAALNLTDSKIKSIIDNEKKTGQLPQLKGVKVWVAGAGAAQSGGLRPAKLNQIQKFWMQYFQAANANLSSDRYSASLLNFSLPGIEQ